MSTTNIQFDSKTFHIYFFWELMDQEPNIRGQIMHMHTHTHFPAKGKMWETNNHINQFHLPYKKFFHKVVICNLQQK